ncbi:MAG TPA: hypothetical protein PKH10_11345, partial [bacterium]|nr:hypothetical protein [bacterium]
DPEKKVVVKNLTLTGGQRQGMYITGITAEISKIAIVSVMGQGLLVDYGGTVSLSSAMVKGTLPLADKTRGRGIAAYDNISLFISKVLVERNKELGIMVATTETTSKSSFDATDLIVRNTASQESDLMWGRGVDISDAVTSTLSRVLVEKNRECGIFSGTWTEGTRNSFTATHLIVRDTQSEEINKWYGRGITLRDNIDATLTHVLVERNREVGLSANTFSDGAKGSMNVTDLIIRDTRSEEESQTLGDGLIVKDSVIAIINRALVERNREVGITIASSSAQTQGSFSATDLTVRNTLEKESDGYAGRGFWILDHPTVVLARTVVEGNRDIGIAISYSAPQEGKGGVLATDLVVRGTVSRTSDQQLGLGISIQDSVEADLDRVLIEQNQYIGLQISTPSDGASGGIDATHLVVRDTGAQKSDAMFGRGISVQGAITSVFDKTLVKGNKEVGLFAGSSTPESPCALSATDLIVIETQSQESDKMFGRGVVARDNVSASFSRALIDSNREVGLVVRTDLPEATGSFDATDLVVRNTWPQESDQTVGRGIDITDNITANINRVLVEQNRDVGIFVATHTDGVQGRFEGKDVMVRNTYAQESDKQWGSGIVFQDNIQSTLKNIAVENNRELGVQLINGDAAGVPIATFVNVIISDTMVRECYELDIDCGYALEAPFGHGLGIYYGAEATLVNVVIDGNQHGLQIKGSKVFAGENCSLPFGEEESETVCLHIINNETGINAFDLPADYDVFAAFANTSTWYEGNGTPFSGDPEDVPEPPDPINDPTEN